MGGRVEPPASQTPLDRARDPPALGVSQAKSEDVILNYP